MDTLEHLKQILASQGFVQIHIRAHPGAKETRFKHQMADGTWKIDIAAAPESGKANEELVRFLAETFGVPRLQVTVVSGQRGRNKIIRLHGRFCRLAST